MDEEGECEVGTRFVNCAEQSVGMFTQVARIG